MIICDLSRAWLQSHNDKIGYSLFEIDIYSFQTPDVKYDIVRPHRLSIRRNLHLCEFEAYRFFYDDQSEDVKTRGSLRQVLEYTNAEWRRVFAKDLKGLKEIIDDRVCTHTKEGHAPDCGMVVR